MISLCLFHMMLPAYIQQTIFYCPDYLWKGGTYKGKAQGERERDIWKKMGFSFEKMGFALHNDFIQLFLLIAHCLRVLCAVPCDRHWRGSYTSTRVSVSKRFHSGVCPKYRTGMEKGILN